MKTIVCNQKNISHSWYLVDATDMVLGRLASKVASVLVGKSKVQYSPNQDHGDHVIVINSEKVRLTGKKADTKTYFRHSSYPGGEKIRSFKDQIHRDAGKVILHAVKGMVPKTALGHKIIKKLHVYNAETHPHSSQKPQPLHI